MRLRTHAVSTIIVGSIVLSGCGSSTPAATTSAEAAKPAKSGVPDPAFNDADVAFAQNMIPHHQQAVEMARIALEKSPAPSRSVSSLAQRIKGAQQPEIDLMTGWLSTWGRPAPASHHMEGADHGSMNGADGMDGMMSSAEMSALASSSGPEFDKVWMELMIKHHQGAVTMARAVQASGKAPEVKALAGRIIEAQESEIEEMTKALAS